MLAGLLVAAVAASAPDVAAEQGAIELSICDDPNTAPSHTWPRSSALHVSRILMLDRQRADFTMRRGICNATMPDSTCSGLPGRLFCRQPSLDRIHMAAAWLLAAREAAGDLDYEAFRRAHRRWVADAFRFADGADRQPSILRFAEELQRFTEAKAVGRGDPEAPPKMVQRARLHERIVAFNFAALVGHEAHHVNAEVCPVSERSRIESDGTFAHIAEVQTSDVLFCGSSPDPNEMKADRCAARQIRRLHAGAIAKAADPRSAETFARRAAADMVAFQALVGFRRYAGLPRGKYVVPGLDQYFRPALRVLVLTAEISGGDGGPRVCGDAADLFVQAVQLDFKACEGGGEVSDELLALLPSGVEKSWNGAAWTADSFSCLAE